MRVYFYPHKRFRDRQLDTIRAWPSSQVANLEILTQRKGLQVEKEIALRRRQITAWTQTVPLINIKRRPPHLKPDVAVYVWGAVLASGPFIVDLDNPYALTGYNLRGLTLYRVILKHILGSRRCLSIRCMSRACRETLRAIFGDKIANKAEVHYPSSGLRMASTAARAPSSSCRFLFVSTQFEIKGGVALLKAFRRLLDVVPEARLDLVTHLPAEYQSLVDACEGAVIVHEANYSRDEIFDNFILNADVLVHPTYMDSFGMVALEAMAGGLGLIVTDVYALPELVEENGFVLEAPISIWRGYLPSREQYQLASIRDRIRAIDTSVFEASLKGAMLRFAQDQEFLLRARQRSIELYRTRFLQQSVLSSEDLGCAEVWSGR